MCLLHANGRFRIILPPRHGSSAPLAALGLCLVAVLAFVPSLRAQAPAKADVLPPVSVEVVRLDVVVTDKGGHPKAGLAREDFTVLETRADYEGG